jgi:hypothetical protein
MSLGLDVGIVDENVASTAFNQIRSSSLLNVESMHLELNSVTFQMLLMLHMLWL